MAPIRAAAWLLCLIATPLVALAQTTDVYVEGFSRARPILRPASDAPTATIRQLRFNNDRQHPRLYSAGDDKLVRSWSIQPTPAGGVQLSPAPSIGWPIYRAVRGVIYALDVQSTPLGDRLAFGGIGAKTSWVNLLHVDRAHQAELHADADVRARDHVVNAVAFHPAGTQLAVAHNRTDIVLLWGLQPEQSTGKSTKLRTGLDRVWYLAYSPRGDRLALAGVKSGTQTWEVQEWDVAQAKALSNQAIPGEVTGLGWGNDTVWLASSSDGIAQRGQNALHRLGHVQALVPPRGTAPYTIALYESEANRTQIATWDGNQKRTDLEGGTFIGKDVAIDVSRDGRFIAAAGAVLDGSGLPVYAVRLWDAATRKPLAQFPDVNLRGTLGAPIANVGVIPGQPVEGGRVTPYKIGFAWGPAPKGNLPAYQFQFDRIIRSIAEHKQGLGREQQPRGIFTAKLGGQPALYLANTANPAQDPWLLPMWADRRPVCYALNGRQTLLALGYNDGILLCDLARLRDASVQDKDKTILRSFYGHEGPVTCLNFAPDGTLLLSGSADGTICAWKIDDVVDPRRRPRSELGVTFDFVPNAQRNASHLTVMQSPAPGSVGAEAGFQKGQQISKVVVAGVPLPFDQWKNYLNAPVPGKELGVVVVQGSRRNDILTVVSHDALWTLYPQQDRNWIVWTQEGHFDAPLEAIDRLAWHVNLNIEEAAASAVAPGECMSLSGRDFQELFHKAKVVDDGLQRLIADKPREHVVPPSLQIEVAGDKVVLTATPNGREPISELELWLNGYRLGRRGLDTLSAGAQQLRLEAQVPPIYRRSDGNQLVAVAAISVIDPATKQAAKIYNRKRMQLPETARPATIARKLHYLGIGVTALAPNFPGAAPLEFAHHDAVELGQVLQQRAGRLSAGNFEVLADYEACQPPTEANIIAALDKLATQVRADDLAVVLFSGHGINTDKGFRFIAKDTPKAEAGRISDQLINDKLALLPCRTLLLLDTCHAEGAQVRQNLQDWPGFGLGPMILASCDAEHESFENERLGLPGGLRGHGLFTASLLECLTGTFCENRLPGDKPLFDGNNDGQISVAEWCAYAKARTTMLSDLAGPFVPAGKRSYTPRVLPSLTFLDHKDLVFAPAPAKVAQAR